MDKSDIELIKLILDEILFWLELLYQYGYNTKEMSIRDDYYSDIKEKISRRIYRRCKIFMSEPRKT